MTKVHIVCGGHSVERDVSLRSGAAVQKALTTAGYEAVTFDLATAQLPEMIACDVVFPVLHGAGGEDGTLQTELETAGIAYVGSGPEASRICFDKWQYRQLVTAAGLPMAEGALVHLDDYRDHPLTEKPYVLKSPTGGSSIDTYIVRNTDTAPHEQIAETFGRYPTMLLEQLIVGTELTLAVLDSKPLTSIEIIPPDNGEFDYENKYNGASRELCPPEHVSEELQRQAQELAFKAQQIAGCRDFSRTDIMLDNDGHLFLLETNTIPGMTDQSLFPKAARTSGIEMPVLCSQLITMALTR